MQPPVQPPVQPPTDLAGLKQRAAALGDKLAPAGQRLAALSQLAAQKAPLETAAAQVKQASDLLQAMAVLQTRLNQVQGQMAQRSDITAALRQRVDALQAALTALQGRAQTVAALAAAVTQAQKDLQAALAGQGDLATLQKRMSDLLAAIKQLRSDLDRPLAIGDEISLQNPAPGVRISQRFGLNPALYKPFGLAGHEGIDFACDIGTAILAAADGVVFRSGATTGSYGPKKDQGPYGIRVLVEHTWGTQKAYTVYAHLSSVAVAAGDLVNAGAVVGKSGNTGNSQGAHLHFSLILVGKENPGYKSVLDTDTWYHDPAPFMPGLRSADDWLEADAGAEFEGEEIICLPPTRPEEM